MLKIARKVLNFKHFPRHIIINTTKWIRMPNMEEVCFLLFRYFIKIEQYNIRIIVIYWAGFHFAYLQPRNEYTCQILSFYLLRKCVFYCSILFHKYDVIMKSFAVYLAVSRISTYEGFIPGGLQNSFQKSKLGPLLGSNGPLLCTGLFLNDWWFANREPLSGTFYYTSAINICLLLVSNWSF